MVSGQAFSSYRSAFLLRLGFGHSVGELVKQDQNGMIFDTAQDLAKQLQVSPMLLIVY